MLKLTLGQKLPRPAVVALGFFDCVHIGHKAVIERAKRMAEEQGAVCAVFTFSDDPASALGKGKQIYTPSERAGLFEELGADAVVSCAFSDVRDMPAAEFAELLKTSLPAVAVAAGEDYTFGAGGKGDTALLAEVFGKAKVETVPFVLTTGGTKVSSSLIRRLVSAGDVEAANELLTGRYFMTGRVLHAHGRGKRLGFPTANIPFPGDREPLAPGVYATVVKADGKRFGGMTNVGARPTFGETAPTVESFVFDFSGDLYDKDITLSFVGRLRDIRDFGSAAALERQLAADEIAARKLLGRTVL